MAAYFVRGGPAYAREEKKAFGHCSASSYQSRRSGLAKKIAAAGRLNRNKLSGMLGFQYGF
jgi:hypothetical protein